MDADSSIYTDYFRITQEYQEKYGPRTVLLMQVGAFFEIYATKEPNGETIRSPIVEVCSICGGLAISEKKQTYGKGQILMAGFRDYTLDKHVQKLMDATYTAVVFVQVKNGTKITRQLASVFSPGTFLSPDSDTNPQITNHIMCIWVDTFSPLLQPGKKRMVCGLAVANIFTGKSEMFEYETECEWTPSAFDELERAVSVYKPSEVVLISRLDEQTARLVLQYSGVQTSSVHLVSADIDKYVLRCSEEKYVRHLISAFFKEDTYEVCEDFHTYPLATQAFAYLLHFIQEHCPALIRNLALPVFYNASTNVALANHTLRQLNVIDDQMGGENQLRSVSAFLNKCCSAIGRRLFYRQLTHHAGRVGDGGPVSETHSRDMRHGENCQANRRPESLP